jgi:HK97 family phage portal protein
MFDKWRYRVAERLIGKAAANASAQSVFESIVRKNAPPKRGSRELAIAYKTSPWLHSLASRVASSFSSIDWTLSVPVDRRTGKAYKNARLQRCSHGAREKALRWMVRDGDARVIDDHPMYELLQNGNPMLSGRTCMELLCLHLDLIGEHFWIIERNRLGMPIEIWPTPPWWVKSTPTTEKNEFVIDVKGTGRTLQANDVVWFRSPDPENPYGRGSGIAGSLGDEIDTDEYIAKYTKTFFFNNALPSAIVSMEGISKDNVKAAEAEWNNKLRGLWNSNRVSFTNAKLDVAQLENTFRDQQVIPLREHERDIIQQVWGVPPEIIGNVVNSNRATVEAAVYIMALFVTVPRADSVRDTLQNRLVNQFDDRIILGYDSPVPEDREYMLRVAQANPSVLTRAEWRDRNGLPSHGKLDDVYVMQFSDIERKLSSEDMPSFGSSPTGDSASSSETVGDDSTDDNSDVEETESDDQDNDAKCFCDHTKGWETKRLTEAQVEQALRALAPETLTVPTEEVFKRNIEKWGSAALASVGSGGVSFDMLNPKIVEHLQNFAGERIGRLVDNTTRESLRSTLVEGVRAGESAKVLAKRVREVFDEASTFRAVRIARTEVVHSSNFATYTAYETVDIVQKRQWVSTPDSRTRDAHIALNGQVKEMGVRFTVGGASAMYPGDFGIASLDVNCRCTIVAVISKPKSTEELAMVWKAYDAGLVPWEKETISTLRAGFDQQQDDVIAALVSLAA